MNVEPQSGRRRGRGRSARVESRHAAVPVRSSAALPIWLVGACIALGVALAYGNSLGAPFVYDDFLTVVENPSIRGGQSLGARLAPPRELPVAGRPLVNLTFAANYATGGLSVTGYHVVNIGLHLLCALLLFGVVRRTLLSQPADQVRVTGADPSVVAFGVALVWALHPLNTDAVSYITQRTELMMAACYLLTLYGSIRAWHDGHPLAWSGLAVAACATGMACKESMVTAPVMVLAYDAIFLGRTPGGVLRRRRWFYASLAGTWLVLLLVSRGARIHSAGFATGVTIWTYLLNQAAIIPHYLERAFWPRSLVLLYGAPLPLSIGDVLPQLVLIVMLIALTIFLLRRLPAIGFLGLWFFVNLAPTSSFVPIATEVGAERRMYLPLMALVVLAVVAAARLMRGRRLAASLVLAGCAVALGFGTWDRNREYASAVELARTSMDRRPSAGAHHALGTELIRAGRSDEGIAILRETTAGEPRAHYSLGRELFQRERWDEAASELEAFVRLRPELLEAVSARQMLGRVYALQGRWPAAIEQDRMVLRMNPTSAQAIEAEGMLAGALFHTNQFDESVERYRRYLAARPTDLGALTNLGIALVALEKLPDAITTFQRIVDIDAESWEGRRNLAMALADAGEPARALSHAEKAVALRPGDAPTHVLLAQLLAANGRLREAQAEIARAAEIDPASIPSR
jgi:tetratricopeptide (TPR) repeat protein